MEARESVRGAESPRHQVAPETRRLVQAPPAFEFQAAFWLWGTTVDTSFSPDENQRILAAVDDGGPLQCPRCDTSLIRVDVAPREDVAYVRNRVWLRCESCGRHAVLDRGAPPANGEEGR